MRVPAGGGKLRRGAIALLLAFVVTIGLAPRALSLPAAGAAPPQPGMGRLWIYRDYEPYESLARPYVRLNGAIIGISEPGGALYRDLRPGLYRVTVDCEGTDVDQFVTVRLAAGQQAFVKILSAPDWDSGGSFHGGAWRRDTFYTWQIAPQAAVAEIVRLPIYDGS